MKLHAIKNLQHLQVCLQMLFFMINFVAILMQTLINLLNSECDSHLPNEVWQEFFALAEEVHYKRNQTIIAPYDIDRNLYILKEGIVKVIEVNNGVERVTGFGLPGSIYKCSLSFCKGLPTGIEMVACKPTVMLRIPYESFWEMARRSHAFAIFMLGYTMAEQCEIQLKETQIHNKSLEERYQEVLQYRPWIAREIPDYVLASYLGVTPEHFSRMKSNFLKSKS